MTVIFYDFSRCYFEKAYTHLVPSFYRGLGLVFFYVAKCTVLYGNKYSTHLAFITIRVDPL